MTVVLGLLLAAIAYVTIPAIYLHRSRRRLQSLCREHQLVCVTFDDGPGPRMTPKVLARLQHEGVRATFFVLTHSAEGREDLLRLAHERSHEVCSHGHRHVHHLKSLPWRGLADTYEACRRLGHLTGRPCHRIPFRPPYGKLNLLSLLCCLLRRVPIAAWTHDSYDTWSNADVPPRMLADTLRRTGGGVVLLHDFDRRDDDADARALQKLDAVLSLRADGYRFVTFGELLQLRNRRTLPAINPRSEPPEVPARRPAAALSHLAGRSADGDRDHSRRPTASGA